MRRSGVEDAGQPERPRRLRQMIDSLCTSLPASGEPYGGYLRRGPRRLWIQEIVFQPEAAGKFDL